MLGRFLFVVIVCFVGCKGPNERACDPFGNCEPGVGKLKVPLAEEPVVVDSPNDGPIDEVDDDEPVSEPIALTACTSGSSDELFTIRTICTAHGLEDINACEHDAGCAALFEIYARFETQPVSEAERKRLWSSFREPMTPERLQLAKLFVRRWDAEFCDSAVPREFLTDAVDLVDQPELLRAMLTPESYNDGPDFLNQIDGRAGLYISAHYGANRVKNTVIQTLNTNGLYRETLPFVSRHGTDKQIADMEASLLKLMKRNHCYSFIEDTKGHFTRWYTFTDDCGVSK